MLIPWFPDILKRNYYTFRLGKVGINFMDEKLLWETKFSTLDKRIKDFSLGYRQNIAILGNDQEEISYLLESYLEQNKSDDTVYIHIPASYINKKEFFKRVALDILSSYSHNEGNLDSLINLNNPSLTATTNFIRNTLKKNTLTLLDTLEVINKFLNESKRKSILIVEDFLKMAELFGNCFKDFSKFIMLQRNCMIILASSCTRETQRIFSDDLNLLFGNFEKILLDENTFFDNYMHLKRKLQPINPSPLFISFFVNILGSNVIYYDVIAEKIKAGYTDNAEEKVIVETLTNSLYAKETYLFQKMLKKVDLLKERFKDSDLTIKILIALGEGYLRKDELVSLNLCERKLLVSKLNKLCDCSYVEACGNIYKIQDPLFAFWISRVFKIHFLSYAGNAKTRAAAWEKMLQQDICLFKEDFFKDKIKRILELLSYFKDDTLKVGKDRCKLPCVEKTKLLSYSDTNIHFLIGEGREIIFAGIKEKNITDNDVIEFIEKSNGIKGKGVKKILMSLEKFTPEAQLIAKNNRLITWDINEINHLMKLYNKPTIPIN
jgi:hypothetical protein